MSAKLRQAGTPSPMAPRSLWNGSIAFGLVTVPVKVYTATESKTVRFREVHAKDGGKIEHRRICPKEGKEVDSKEIVRGYQVSARKWVELTDEEIAAAAGPQTRLIVVDHSDFDLGTVRRKPTGQEIKMASSLVEGLHTRFDPSDYEDTYREDVLKLIEAK